MYICDDCRRFFEEPVRVVFDDHPELQGYKEYRSGCPHCKSAYIDDAYICDKCGEYVSASEACFEGDKVFCESCLDKLDDSDEHELTSIFNKLDNIFSNAFKRGTVYG